MLDIEAIRKTAASCCENPIPFGPAAVKILSKLVVDLCDVIAMYESLVGKVK